ncbi:MAG: exonuclease subunit SbcD, partial [Actinobacteria bacterium]|nr:exonuclease subunit SbcD [Actinomycetota bacterium]
MRLLHTSDLHLGRSLNGHDLSVAQGAFLDRIVETAVERSVDVVLVAGDVYDRTLPPVESVAAFESFLVRLHALGIAVVVISGNHDQAVRLGYGSALFQHGVHLLTDPARVQVPVEFADEHGPVLVYGLPYLQPELTRRILTDPDGPDLPATHEAVVGAAMTRVRADLEARGGSPRVVVVAHAFVVGGEEGPVVSTSERDVSVGGLQTVPSAVFA